ncbi:hypothetical protein CesoFtcFv8_000476 [Champsocephalus esox]|uniref:Uncharacterized protein n=1 Tax=Champsocephalus esox TaxID=159716 RepID=A0AAN8HGT3_9TELE|nr:hypothetical protein CesoFtcFv8_000476 [Champsocephalus esox]
MKLRELRFLFIIFTLHRDRSECGLGDIGLLQLLKLSLLTAPEFLLFLFNVWGGALGPPGSEYAGFDFHLP